MHGRLALNRDQVDECRRLARLVAEHLQKNTERHTTFAVEQAVLRAMGAAPNSPHPIIHAIAKKVGVSALGLGIAGWIGRVMVARRLSPLQAANYLAKDGLSRRDELNQIGWGEAQRMVRDAMNRWQQALPKSPNDRSRNGHFSTAVQLGTGSSAQDLAAYGEWSSRSDMAVVHIPSPPPPYDGMPVERRNWFRRSGYNLHHTLNGVSKEAAIPVCFQGSGVPEFSVIATLHPQVRLGVDPVSLIRISQIDPHKVFIDYAFINRLSAKTGLVLHHDLSTWGSPEFLDLHLHQVLALQIVLEQWLMFAGGEPGHRVLVWPSLTRGKTPLDGASLLALVQLVRELFPQSEIWQHVSTLQPAWDIGFSSLIGFTGAVVPVQSTHIMPLVKEWGGVIKPLSYEFQFSDHGHVSRRMHTLLERCTKELNRLHRTGLTRVVVQDHGGLFAMGKSNTGSDSVVEKDRRYWNPLEEFLK